MSADKPKGTNLLIRKMAFPSEYGLFIAVNLLEVLLAVLRFRTETGGTSPSAGWIFLKTGPAGYVAYKVVLMLVVVFLCEAVAARRRVLARVLIWLAIAALTVVTVNSGLAYHRQLQISPAPPEPGVMLSPLPETPAHLLPTARAYRGRAMPIEKAVSSFRLRA